ncbi:MAG: hypothetical protein ONA69_03180, partial [candidate division KSB1 bacterium]|nr:hypothetical protein [candidate division KSB1 bacterium]
FLESPGIFGDGQDNDGDGLIDERRDNGPGVWLDSYPYGIADVEAFKKFYPNTQLRPHWSGDENINWDSYLDLNENGVWDFGEPLRDDLGEDGLGPNDPNYPGPDEGEGDGIPTPGEPDFGFTDKDESDQIGLTGFNVFVLHEYKMENDEAYWKGLVSAPPPRDKLVQNTNLGMFFSSGPFRLEAGETQFYSMALLFGEDQKQLARTKKTIQQIYNASYRFAKPPEKPRVTAVAGDRRVVLYWDDKAESSWDPFLQEYDFEGYRIYRTTDPEFLEAQIITNAYGKKILKQPIAQFDLKNGIKGLHPIDVDGIKYYLGDDTGLRHYFIDTDVKNGQTYYYAVVSYDRGHVETSATGELAGIPPSESPSIIKMSAAGVIEFMDINTAVVTPQAPAAGYDPPHLADGVHLEGPATGSITVELLDPTALRDGHEYQIQFKDTTRFGQEANPWYSLKNLTTGELLFEDERLEGGKALSPVAEGLAVSIVNDTKVKVDEAATGWVEPRSDVWFRVGIDSSLLGRHVDYPADFEILFFDHSADTSKALLFGQKAIPVNFMINNVTENRRMEFLVTDKDRDGSFTPGDHVTILIGNRLGEPLSEPRSKFKTSWAVFWEAGSPAAPRPGDVFRIHTSKPFRNGETARFTVRSGRMVPDMAKNQLDRITVVPNPYRAAASWESRSPFQFGRGERKIYFNNLPQKCTIRIYTVRGYLVDTIEHDGIAENGSEAWDLLSKDGMEIAYGVYLYHVDAPGVGTYVGKFAVIK